MDTSGTSPPDRWAVQHRTPADLYLERAQPYAHVPVKQAIISPSALSLLYLQCGISGYSRQDYLDDLLNEQEGEIRRCLQKGAHVVQIDFTEGRLSVKLDPTRRLLESFIDLNSLLIERFSADERRRIGVHRALKIIRNQSSNEQRIFVGVTNPIDPRVESPDEVRDRVLEAADCISPERLGTTDDSGFAPFSDGTSRSRETAFAKIRSRVSGTAPAAAILGVA